MAAAWSASSSAWLPITIKGRSARASASAARAIDPLSARGGSNRTTAGAACVGGAIEHLAGVAVQVPAQQPVAYRRALAGRVRIPLADQRLVVQQIDGTLDKDRAGHAAHGVPQPVLDRRTKVTHLAHARHVLDVRRDQRALVDVLQRAASLQRSRRCASEQQHRALGELRVLQRGDRVRQARAGGHGRHAGTAGQPRHRVGREHGRRFVAGVDDADAARPRRREDRRDVPAAQREDERNAVGVQDIGDAIAAVPRGQGWLIHAPVSASARASGCRTSARRAAPSPSRCGPAAPSSSASGTRSRSTTARGRRRSSAIARGQPPLR